MKDKRKTEVLKGDTWEKCNLIDVKHGNYFRVFESTGESVKINGNTVFVAIGDGFLNENEIPAIKADVERFSVD